MCFPDEYLSRAVIHLLTHRGTEAWWGNKSPNTHQCPSGDNANSHLELRCVFQREEGGLNWTWRLTSAEPNFFWRKQRRGCINKRILSFSSTRRWDVEVGRGGTKTSDLRRSFWFHFSLKKRRGTDHAAAGRRWTATTARQNLQNKTEPSDTKEEKSLFLSELFKLDWLICLHPSVCC